MLLPQHDAQDSDRVVVDALEMLLGVARLEVMAPASQHRVEPVIDEVGEIPVLPGTSDFPDSPLDGRRRLWSRIRIGVPVPGAAGALHHEPAP